MMEICNRVTHQPCCQAPESTTKHPTIGVAKTESSKQLIKNLFYKWDALEEHIRDLKRLIENVSYGLDDLKQQSQSPSCCGCKCSRPTNDNQPPKTDSRKQHKGRNNPTQFEPATDTNIVSGKLTSPSHSVDDNNPDYSPAADLGFCTDHLGFRTKRYNTGKPKWPTKGGCVRKSPPPELRRNLFVNYGSGFKLDNVSGESSKSIQGKLVPNWMSVAFRPSEEMGLAGVKLAVAAYIFNNEKDSREILAEDAHCTGDRNNLMTLVPGSPIIDDVLTLVASMLSFESPRDKWFLPPSFGQLAHARMRPTEGTMELIRTNYMGYFDRVSMAVQLEKWLDNDSWYMNKAFPRARIGCFKIDQPRVTQQDVDFNDCGVWIAQWMIMSHLWTPKSVERVTDETRMKLVVDLVVNEYNPIRNDIIKLALEF